MARDFDCYIEIGNTTIKVARRDAGAGFAVERFADPATSLRAVQAGETALVAPVAGVRAAEILPSLERADVDVTVIERSAFAAFVGDSYDTPDTLGLDRILNLYALDADGIVISCGTAVTVDAAADGRPYWGAIGPGFGMTARAMIEHAPDLPLVGIGDLLELPSRTSRASVAYGVFRMLADGIQHTVERMERAVGRALPCIVTGGDAAYLTSLWTRTDALEEREHLIFEAMAKAA
jgi:pantothenate kinase type III